jgi:hypothetical protein
MTAMLRTWLLVSVLVPSFSAAAGEHYVPLSPESIVSFTNRSETPAVVAVDCSGSVEMTLLPGETRDWTGSSAACGAAAIRTGDGVTIEAVSRCESCGSRTTIPLLDPSDRIVEGTIATAVVASDRWRQGIGFINPHAAPTVVLVSVGETHQSVEIPARGTRLLDAAGASLRFDAPQGVLAFRYAINGESGAHVYSVAAATGRKRRAVRSGFPSAPVPQPQTITLFPSKDNTLYETASGSSSNGRGPNIFAGATATGGIRRAALAFDIVSLVPPGSQIRSVTLRLQLSKTISGPHLMQLRPITKDWGEGTSNAGTSNDGDGAASTAGDATWVHNVFPDQRWTNAGGDFAATADGSLSAAGDLLFPTSAELVARVQGWLDQPATNFGWMLLGDEGDEGSAKRYFSREAAEARRPVMTIEFLPR